LTKPCETPTLTAALELSVRQYQLLNAERELLTRTLQSSLIVLLDALAIAKPEAFGRNERICKKSMELSAGLPGIEPWEMQSAALLSQLGCVAEGAA